MWWTRLLAAVANFFGFSKSFVRWLGGAKGLGGVCSAAMSVAFYAGFGTMVSKILAALQELDLLTSSVNAGSAVDSSFLSQVNFFLPLDTLATVIVLYFSLWVGVRTFGFWVKWIGVAGQHMEKAQGQ